MDAKGSNVGNGDVATAPTTSRESRVKKLARLLFRGSLYGAAVSVGLGLAGYTWWSSCGYKGCPSASQLTAWRPSLGGELLDRDGKLIGALSPIRRENISLSKVPAHLKASFLAVEDRRFYRHHGIDWHGVGRAFVNNVKAFGVREGGSTISMQLARNMLLADRASERSVTRKLLEVRYAKLLEKALTKDEILERYLNTIYLGNGTYGVEAASRDLFGKGVEKLTLADAALLAGLPKAPSTYSPRRSVERATARRAVVLGVMERERVASHEKLKAARHTPIKLAKAGWDPSRNIDSWALEVTHSVLDSLRGVGEIPKALGDQHLVVYSTFDRKAQAAAQRAVAAGARQVDAERYNSRANPTQGALVAIDPSNGAIRAIVGGRQVERKGFNRALRARRQAGSTFKPFVYAAALMHGYTTATMVDDDPVSVETDHDLWTPANYGGSYAGSVTLRDALTRSANAATVRVSRDIGILAVADQARAQGITSKLPLVPALALGAGSVTPLELTTAYAPFANGGTRVTTYVIEKVEDNFGRVLWEHDSEGSSRALEATDAFLVTSMLQSVVNNGTGSGVRAMGIRGPVAGKTGTTNDGADVWFVGFTPTLVAGVWFGADEPASLGARATGGRFAAPTWARFIRDGWHSPEDDANWAVPFGIEKRSIDVATGLLASDWCGDSREEYFRVGTGPRENCEDDFHFRMGDLLPDYQYDANPSEIRPSRRSRSSVSYSTDDVGRVVDQVKKAIQGSDRGRELTRSMMSELKAAIEEQAAHGRGMEKGLARDLTREMRRQFEQQMERQREAAGRERRSGQQRGNVEDR